MSQDGAGGENIPKNDPLHDVKEEIEHGSPRLKHVDRHEKTPEDVLSEGVIHSEVPEAFVAELKDDHYITEGVHTLTGSKSGFMSLDPMHDVKQEIEHNSPRLRHVETDSADPPPQSGDVVKSEVPEAFVEELKNDHDIVKESPDSPGSVEGDASAAKDHTVTGTVGSRVMRVPPTRGTPHFRISAHHGMRAGGPLSRELENVQATGNAAVSKADDAPQTEEASDAGSLGSGRGTTAYRISAQHGTRPGGPLARDLKPENAESGSVEGVSADSSSDVKLPKIPGSQRPSRGGAAGPRRGGLARTGSGVPGESKGGGSLARTGSGVPGNSLARQGSGVPGNSLARTGSGVPGNSLARQNSGVPGLGGNNDLKDISSYLETGNVPE